MTNATPIEAIFVLLVAIGVGCNAWCLREAVIDRRVIFGKQECTEMAWIVANGNVRAEWVRLSVQVSLLSIGILSLFAPPALDPPDGQLLFTYRLCVRLGFFIATIALVVNSMLNVHERRRILRLNGHADAPIKRRWKD